MAKAKVETQESVTKENTTMDIGELFAAVRVLVGFMTRNGTDWKQALQAADKLFHMLVDQFLLAPDVKGENDVGLSKTRSYRALSDVDLCQTLEAKMASEGGTEVKAIDPEFRKMLLEILLRVLSRWIPLG
jgi:hypothetical protein